MQAAWVAPKYPVPITLMFVVTDSQSRTNTRFHVFSAEGGTPFGHEGLSFGTLADG